MALTGLGQPFGGGSRLINVGAPVGIGQALGVQQQGLDRLGAGAGSFMRNRKQNKQRESDQQKFSKALGILRTGNGSPESQTQAVDILSTVETPGYTDFVKQLNASLLAKELDPVAGQQAQAELDLTKAQTEKTRAEGSGILNLRKLHRDRNAAINAGNEVGEKFYDTLIEAEKERMSDFQSIKQDKRDPLDISFAAGKRMMKAAGLSRKPPGKIKRMDKVAPDIAKEIKAAAQDGMLTDDEIKSIEDGLAKDPSKAGQVLDLIRSRKGR